jgi:ABC-type branched-subunit amino acid transport system permease subunit
VNYFVNILVLINLYVILAVSFNILLGYGGLFSIAHAAFYGVGAYTSALVVAHLGLPIPLAIVVAMAFTGVLGFALATPVIRVSGDYLAVVTLGLQIIIVRVLLNLDFTGGPAGLTGIKRMTFLGQPFTAPTYALLTGVIAIVAVLVVRHIVRSPWGRVLKGIREDAVATESLGKNVNAFKLTSFTIATMLAAVAGGLYAHYFQYINPYDYQVQDSVLILSMVIVGGIGTVWGPVVGAVLLVAIPEALRFAALPTSVGAALRQVIYAVVVLGFIYLRPEGVVGRRGGDTTVGRRGRLEALLATAHAPRVARLAETPVPPGRGKST